MTDASVSGADSFYALSRRMKDAGQTQLRKELNKAMRDVAKPLIAQTRQAASQKLPQRGGLARRYSKQPQRVRVRTGASTAGVSIVLAGQPGITTGQIRHPVFGHKGRFVTQQVNGEWWDGTLEASGPAVQAALIQVLSVFAARLAT